MKRLAIILACVMLAAPVYADHGVGEHGNTNCNGEGNSNSPCEGGDGGGGGGGGGEGGGSSTNDNTNTNTSTNRNNNDNTNTQGQQQGQIQGQIATGGDASATGGDSDATSIAGAGVFGSGNSDNTNTATGGEGGEGGDGFGIGVGIGVGGEGGNATINIGTGGYDEEGGEGGSGSGVLSSNVGDTTSTSTSSTGDQTTNVSNTDNSFDGGNTLIIGGGGQGECYEEECSGGSGTLNSNATVGDTTATGGNATGGNASNGNQTTDVTVNIGEDGPLTASSQEVATSATIEEGAVVIEGDSTVYEAPKIPVATAATSFSSVCTSGAGVQRQTYGLSLAVTSDVCMHLMMADAWMAMGDIDKALKSVTAAGKHASVKGFMGYIRHVVTIGIL